MNFGTVNTEKELLQLASQGDEKSFIRLFHSYKHRLHGFLMKITESQEVTEDIIQDVFLKLWKDKSTLGNIDNLGGYIYRMGQHQAINIFKRNAKETLILAELQKQIAFSTGAAEENLALKETAQKIKEALELLTPQQKQVYTLSRERGMKYEEIARQLNISPSTVKNHLILALRTLRERLSDTNTLVMAGWLVAIIQSLKIIFRNLPFD